jgi:hypothetical protein
MNLPAELFEEIADSINIISRDQPREADRRSPRVRLSSHLSVAMWSDPLAPVNLRIRDLSSGGMGIFHTSRIGLDEQVVVRFPRANDQTVLVLATVVYWEPLAENLFGIGVQFDRLVEERELKQQSEQNISRQFQDIGVMARLSQSLARTWRIAS